MAQKNLWTREELILALNLYLKLPFGRINSRTPEIIHLAKLIGRTPDAVSMRLSNYASVDPFHQKRGVVGLRGGIKQVQPIWDEFENNREELLFESERMLAQHEESSLERKYAKLLSGTEELTGETKIREVKTRINQNVFRDMVLANYSGKCAITGIDIPEMLIASHIIPWSQNKAERLNPSNGICLSTHFDTAFDKGFITFDKKYRLLISTKLNKYVSKPYYQYWFKQFEGIQLDMPAKYLPSLEFLEWHKNFHLQNSYT